MKLVRAHHQAIWKILEGLDRSFLQQHNILFGGGTRIAMELDEYRESVDFDLFCCGREAYRAARSSIVNHTSFGSLFQAGRAPALFQGREIRVDRDAIRSMLEVDGRPIKFGIIHFDNDDITADSDHDFFPVPAVSRESCFAASPRRSIEVLVNHMKIETQLAEVLVKQAAPGWLHSGIFADQP